MAERDAIALIKRLIAFPTISADGNAELIDFAVAHLAPLGFRIQRFDDPTEPKANLLASIGPVEVPGLLLSGHSDVVPVAGQAWSGDPFEPWVADGRLYGRGACDMKGFLGLLLAAAPKMAAASLSRPIHLAFSYDEEVGCAGVRSLIDHLAQMPVPPAVCLVGEPTEMRVTNGHKGICTLKTRVRGRPAHSSDPAAGVSAAAAAARLVCFLEDDRPRIARETHDPAFAPPHMTLNIGRVAAGEALNIIAEHAVIDWEMRPVPGADPKQVVNRLTAYAEAHLLPQMRAVAPEAAIETDILADAPPLSPQDDNPAEKLIQRLIASNETQRVAFATEAGLFQHQAGVPTVVCGPGSIDQAHKADEYVELAQLDAAADLIDRLIDWASQPPDHSPAPRPDSSG